MTAVMEKVSREDIMRLIYSLEGLILSSDDVKTFNYCLMLSPSLWIGKVDSKFVCAWGLIPPTILSEQAYLWLFVTEAVKDHEFLFVRHSQMAVREMLKEYPIIHGLTKINNERAIRWLRWLGASFQEPHGEVIPFRIRAK